MTDLPRILVIDDEYGRASGRRNRHRENFCSRLGLRDITGDVEAEAIDAPLAEAVFCSAQRQADGYIENDVDSALKAVRKGWQKWPRWAAVLLDLHFKTGKVDTSGEPAGRNEDRDPAQYLGLTILESIDRDPGIRGVPVVILSAMARQHVEARFSDRGAMTFADKSALTPEGLEDILWRCALLEDDTMIGHSVPLLEALRDARRMAGAGNGNVLVIGEPGTGKELLGRYIHQASLRSGRKGPYGQVFTQSVPETLLDDRLFGHVKGAFNGANRDMPGPAEEADGGTLFIDEFGCVSGEAQKKLLRLLDKNIRETQRVGSAETKQVDLLIVLASNHSDMFGSEEFRSGILSRIGAGAPIRLPPLRERRDDIPVLAEHFVRKYESDPRTISPEAMELLESYEWPENVRELEDAIERAIKAFPDLRYLSARHLRLSIHGSREEAQQRSDLREGPHSTSERSPRIGSEPIVETPSDVQRGVVTIADIEPEQMTASQLKGQFPACIELLARILKASLVVTKKPTVDRPDGELSLTRAVQLMTGTRMKTTPAASLVKRLIKLYPDLKERLLSDPLLREVYEQAESLRPK